MNTTDMKQKYVSAHVHEMNNIAANISGAVDLLLENKITDAEILEKYLKVVSASVGDLKMQIHNLLMLNKTSGYEESLTQDKFDLNEVAKSQLDSLKAVGDKKKIKLKFKSNLKQPITADKDKLTMVISNLLGNAVKYTDKGEVLLEIKQLKTKLEISVSDTGCGIDEKKIENLFECYSQEDSKQDGYGIGLYITAHFVKMHGGNIEVKSKKGEGSIFKVIFPA